LDPRTAPLDKPRPLVGFDDTARDVSERALGKLELDRVVRAPAPKRRPKAMRRRLSAGRALALRPNRYPADRTPVAVAEEQQVVHPCESHAAMISSALLLSERCAAGGFLYGFVKGQGRPRARTDELNCALDVRLPWLEIKTIAPVSLADRLIAETV
jgi:hypothetical protein